MARRGELTDAKEKRSSSVSSAIRQQLQGEGQRRVEGERRLDTTSLQPLPNSDGLQREQLCLHSLTVLYVRMS